MYCSNAGGTVDVDMLFVSVGEVICCHTVRVCLSTNVAWWHHDSSVNHETVIWDTLWLGVGRIHRSTQ